VRYSGYSGDSLLNELSKLSPDLPDLQLLTSAPGAIMSAHFDRNEYRSALVYEL
jgi:hypothetical protein